MNSRIHQAISILQKQAMLVRQLEEEVVKTRQHAKETNPEIKAHIEGLQLENDHLTREVAILKETIKVSPNLLRFLGLSSIALPKKSLFETYTRLLYYINKKRLCISYWR